jgi:hypothetical protein
MLEAQHSGEEKKEEDFKSRLPHIPKRKAGLDDDVKIFDKIRVRDIKVLPGENAGVAKIEESVPEKPVEKTVDSPIIPIETQSSQAISETGSANEQDIPIIENIETETTAVAHSETPGVPKEEQLLGGVDYFEIPASVEPVTSVRDVKAVEEESVPIEHLEMEPAEVTDVTAEEPIRIGKTEESLDSVPEHPSIALIQVEEDVLNANEQAELQDSEEPIAQEIPKEVFPSVQEIVIEQVPQAVAPTTKEQDDSVPSGEPLTLAEVPHSDSVAPHPKTRWKLWKEKIQGFIKKLFG